MLTWCEREGCTAVPGNPVTMIGEGGVWSSMLVDCGTCNRRWKVRARFSLAILSLANVFDCIRGRKIRVTEVKRK